MAEMLQKMADRQMENRRFLGDAYEDHDLVFFRPDGRPIDPDAVTRKFRGILDGKELPHLTIKDLRHVFATFRLAEGASVADVQAQLGHATATTTLDFYADPIQRHQAEMVDQGTSWLGQIDGRLVDEIGRWHSKGDRLMVLPTGKNHGDPPQNRTENRLIKSQLLCLVELAGLDRRL